jgi:predicted N-acyltransferase
MFVEELKNMKEWCDFLKNTSEATFYHDPKWKEVIQRSFGHSPAYLAIRDQKGELVGICPGFILDFLHLKTYDSIPYSDYGGPVIANQYIKQASLSLLSSLQSFCSEKHIAYAKILLSDNESARSFQPWASLVDSSVGVVEIDLDATPSDFIWNKIFSGRMRKRIRLIERDGFQAQEARTKSDLRDFYFLYCKNMKHIGASPYDYKFMENIWDILYPENLRIWTVGKKRRIGGITVFKHGPRIYWVYVGIDREYSGQYSIVPYLVWREIKKAEEEGYRYISLGSTSSDRKDPHHLQKIGFGGLFHQQKTMWYPFSSTGRILIQTRAKAVPAWKTTRDFLPNGIKSFLENRLSRI